MMCRSGKRKTNIRNQEEEGCRPCQTKKVEGNFDDATLKAFSATKCEQREKKTDCYQQTDVNADEDWVPLLVGKTNESRDCNAISTTDVTSSSSKDVQQNQFHPGFKVLLGLNKPSNVKKPSLTTKQNDIQGTNLANTTTNKALRTTVSQISAEPAEPMRLRDEASEEKGFRKEAVSSEGNNCTSTSPGEVTSSEPNTLAKDNTSTTPQLYDTLCFEAQFMGLASATLLCYCIAHITIYELIYVVLLEMTELRVENLTVLYASILVTGIVILRLTGFLWLFLSSKQYRRTKATLKKRREEGSWDARVQDWFEDRPCLKTALEVLGFYLCYISLSFFFTEFLSRFFDQREAIYEQLPSALHRSINGSTDADGSCNADPKDLEEEDYEFIYRMVAKASYYQYSGDLESPLFSAQTGIMVYLGAGALSIYCLSQAGLSFVDSW